MARYENLEYERGVIGRFILAPEEMDLNANLAEVFSDQRNRKIYEAIYKARAKGDEIGVLSLPSIVDKGLVGTAAGFTSEAVLNTAFYIEQLKELYAKRRLDALLRNAVNEIENVEARATISAVETALLEVAQQSGSGYVGISKAVHDAVAKIEERRFSGRRLSGVDTGIDKLDSRMDGLQKQEMVVIGARPGTGKTAIALQMAWAAIEAGTTVGFFSAEMGRAFLMQRMLSQLTGIEGHSLRTGNVTDSHIKQIVGAAAKLYDAKMFLNDRANITIGELISEARLMKRRDDVGVIFIDYLSLITHEDRKIQRHEQMAEVSRRIKQLARELDIPIVLLSQISRDSEGKRPQLSQLRETGALEQDADSVLFLWDEDEGGDDDARRVVLTIAKQRNGPVGEVPLLFIKSKMRFFKRDRGDE